MTQIPYTGNLDWIHTHTLFLTKHGSHAYGLSTPTSDLDLKGFAVAPKHYATGFLNHFDQIETRTPADMVIYNLHKFFKLAADCNPNILEVLFTHPDDHILTTPLAQRILDRRQEFLSQKAKHTFSGYAMAQLKRIKTHRKWLLDPPSAPPKRADHNLPPTPALPQDQILAAEDMIRRVLEQWDIDLGPFDRSTRLQLRSAWTQSLAEMNVAKDAQWRAAARIVGLEENFIQLLEQERLFRTREKEWNQFETWQKGRNASRAALEKAHGLDTKHAMHLVRLMRMCREILTTGEVHVRREDREELMAIRNGSWSFDRLISWAEDEDQALHELRKDSPLPRSPNRKALDLLCQEVTVEAWEFCSKKARG